MKNILVIGDSHIKSFKNKTLLNYKFDTLKFGGASAQGLNNIQSQKKTLKKVQKFFKKNKKNYDFVILCFGEVDCNATIWMYKEKYNVSLRKQFFRSVKNYKKFIKKEVEPYFQKDKIFLLGPILPTIPTKNNLLQNSKMRRQIDITQSTRTRITNLFNYYIANLGYSHYTINHLLKNNETGLIDTKFHNEFNHHINKNIAQELWLDILPV